MWQEKLGVVKSGAPPGLLAGGIGWCLSVRAEHPPGSWLVGVDGVYQ